MEALCAAVVMLVEQVVGDLVQVGARLTDLTVPFRLQHFEAGLLGEVLDVVFTGQSAAEVEPDTFDVCFQQAIGGVSVWGVFHGGTGHRDVRATRFRNARQ